MATISDDPLIKAFGRALVLEMMKKLHSRDRNLCEREGTLNFLKELEKTLLNSKEISRIYQKFHDKNYDSVKSAIQELGTTFNEIISQLNSPIPLKLPIDWKQGLGIGFAGAVGILGTVAATVLTGGSFLLVVGGGALALGAAGATTAGMGTLF